MAEQRLYHLANHDPLTGLPNRFQLFERLVLAIAFARRNREHVVVMFIDLDGFKLVNDTLGHEAGDLLLKEVAQRLRSAVRDSDIVARLGGDEFVVVLTDLATTTTVDTVANNILEGLAAPHVLGGKAVQCKGSIGIVRFPEDGETTSDLMAAADTAMYHAKEMGRGNFQYFDSGMARVARERT
jgi:diguanylate cyclase (GGDEF)-like protein